MNVSSPGFWENRGLCKAVEWSQKGLVLSIKSQDGLLLAMQLVKVKDALLTHGRNRIADLTVASNRL